MSKQTESITNKLAKPENKLPETFAGKKSGEMQLLLDKYKGAIAQVIPKHLNAERLIGLAVNLLSHNPALAACTVQSVIGGVIQASIMGFELNSTLGHCYLIPRKGFAEFQIGYKGMNKLGYQNPSVMTIKTVAVYEGETFIHEEGLNPVLDHRNIKGSGKLTHSYAVITLTNGGKIFEVLNREQIEAIKMRSPASTTVYSPWNNKYVEDYDQMAMKTALRRIFNKGEMPYSIEMKYAALDGHKIELDSFFPDQSGEVNLANLEEVQGEVVTETQPDAKTEEKPKETKKEKPAPVKEEKPVDDPGTSSLNDDFEKQSKNALLTQIKEENRKSEAGKAKLAQILHDNKVDTLVRLGEVLSIELLQSCLDVIKMVNEEYDATSKL